jgi:hypothetical protein
MRRLRTQLGVCKAGLLRYGVETENETICHCIGVREKRLWQKTRYAIADLRLSIINWLWRAARHVPLYK